MNIENAKQQMKKGVIELCVLSIIKNNESYPSDIINELQAAKIIVVEGTLYPLLTRLKNNGLLSYRWVESESGPPRKYYSLTADGETYFAGLLEAWQELTKVVNKATKK
ncbi:MAG TPA: PadR family transcriptional regulator [Flavobacteriales bacterium]|nr:PadR family transcriptional regulator [Flavobacteriales bacterium]